MSSHTPVTLLGSERITMKSSAMSKEYLISIALPYTYTPDDQKGGPFSRALAAWPVIYLTDANWHFGMVTDMVREAAWCGRSTGAIIVGIGYPELDSPQETWRTVSASRSTDLTPVHSIQDDRSDSEWLNRPVTTGGGENFLAFLKQELVPWVEQTYRADPAMRVLAGHSYGGSFALYAMLQDPALFSHYIAASPYLRGGSRALFEMESAYASSHQDLAANLYLTAGDLEESADDTTLSDMHRIAALLESRKYNGFTLTKQVFADNNHCEVAAPALHAGLSLLSPDANECFSLERTLL